MFINWDETLLFERIVYFLFHRKEYYRVGIFRLFARNVILRKWVSSGVNAYFRDIIFIFLRGVRR